MTTISALNGIHKSFPIVGCLPEYKPGWLCLEMVAGLTAAVVVITQVIAYATIAGLTRK